ncbi:unnamed protein product [Choristocarpus tenellus]
MTIWNSYLRDSFLSGMKIPVLECVLQWLDLDAHLRLREASIFLRDEVPRTTTSLVMPGSNLPHIFPLNQEGVLHSSPIRHFAVDFAEEGRGPYWWAWQAEPQGSIDEASEEHDILSGGRVEYDRRSILRETLSCILKDYRPVEFRLLNINHGRQLSDALSALEEQPGSIGESLCILEVSLDPGGPRPYQDSSSHEDCMRRLGSLLTRDVLWRDSGPSWRFLQELRLSCSMEEGDLEALVGALSNSRALYKLSVLVLEGHPHRAKTTNLLALAKALSSQPRVSSGLSSGSSRPNRSREPHSQPARLITLQLRHFQVVGQTGLETLGCSLSDGDRFPHLATLALDNCHLDDDQTKTLTTALLGMASSCRNVQEGMTGVTERDHNEVWVGNRGLNGEGERSVKASYPRVCRLSSLSLRSNYGLSCKGLSALAGAMTIALQPAVCLASSPFFGLESLDLSFSGWWRANLYQGSGGGVIEGDAVVAETEPLTPLFHALGAGCCPSLRFLGLGGCYFGDTETLDLAVALETGLRCLKLVDISRNLFSEVGVSRLAQVMQSDIPQGLTLRVLDSQEPPPRELHSGMRNLSGGLFQSLPLSRWMEYQDCMIRKTTV